MSSLAAPLPLHSLGLLLRAAGVVADRRDGSCVHYRSEPQADPERERSLRALVASFARRAGVQRGVMRLRRASGPEAGA